MRRAFCMFVLALAPVIPAVAQQAPAGGVTPHPRAEVLVLGVYHMANPGLDVFNTKADDVLAPKRQAEIAQVVSVLEKFRPTKIAVEGEAGDDTIPNRYSEYLAGRHELTRNEVEQLGFRLARTLGLQTVYPTDVGAEFPLQRLANYAKGSGRSKEFDAVMADIEGMVKRQEAYLASHTVLQTLLYMNSDERVAEDVGYYLRQAAIGEPYDWAGADLLAAWYRRNARIYSNVMQLVGSPDERILVIFGAGHLGWLRQDFANNPDIRLRTLAEFAK